MAHFGGSSAGAVSATQVAVTPTGGVAATNAQAAIAELDTEKATVVALNAEIAARGTAEGTLTAAAAAAQTTANNALPKAGGTMTGPIVLSADPGAALQPVTLQYLNAAITALINGAPAALDTLKEISDQLATDESAVSALTTTVGTKLAKASNLSDLANATTARSNLGLGTAAQNNTGDFQAAGTAALKANNLSDLASAATARTNLGLGNVDNTSDTNKPVSTAQATADTAATNAAVTASKGLPLALTGATAPTRFVGGTASGAPASGTFAIGDFVIDQTGTIYVCTVAGSPGTWVAPSGGGGVAGVSSIWGDGSDGTVSISSGTTTLTRDMYYDTLTISGTGILNPAGYRIWVKNICTLGGSGGVICDGNTAVSQSGAAAVANQLLQGGTAGGTSTTTTGGAGVNATATNPNGGAGGAGGAGAGGTAGAGGINFANGTGNANAHLARKFPTAFIGQETTPGQSVVLRGGSGGGGGGGTGAATGGGGGGGAGAILINARIFINNALVAARGGVGASTATVGAGGGGGGGGGNVLINTTSSTGSGSTAVTGGAGGSGGGTGGLNGSNGANGQSFINVWT